jgi:hypothetical protein
MLRNAIGLVTLALLVSPPLHAAIFCSEPVEPYCAGSDSTYDDELGIKRCRSDVEEYVGGMEGYAKCLEAQQEEVRGWGSALKQWFECRASGKADCVQPQRRSP